MENEEGSDHSSDEIFIRASEATHEMSNSVGTATSLLQTYIRDEHDHLVPEPVIKATELMGRATGDLRKLMWELQNLRRNVEGMAGK